MKPTQNNLPASIEPGLWGYRDAARYAGVTVKTVMNWIRDGRVSVIRIRHVVRFDPEKFKRELAAFEQRSVTAA
jgi:hypothetical protein